MQLVRIAAVAVTLAAFAGRALGDDEFVLKTQIYVDNDATVVVSPLARIAKDAWKGATLGASFVADVVSSASIDVITNATTHMSDFRKQATASLSQKIADTTLSGGYIYSVENDYHSHNVHVGLSQDLLQRNTTLGLGYSLSLNDVGRSGDSNFHRALNVHSVDAAWTQVVNQRTLLQLSGEFQYAGGYQASPYRFVRVESSPDFKVPETDPDRRLRGALVLGLNRHLATDTALQGDLRFYYDDWGIKSLTFQLRYLVNFGNLSLRVRERFYYQTAASFFASHYTEVHSYVTADRELSTFWEELVGAKLTYKIPSVAQGLLLEAKVDVFYFQYLDFAYLASRLGSDIEAGLTVLY